MSSTPRLSAFFIDCSDETWEVGVPFWSAAFGIEPVAGPDPAYLDLPGAMAEVTVQLQKIGAPSRYHVDFEADDVETEVVRFEGLGATRVAHIESWWVMRAPTGHLFCVVPTGH